jgi:hypothetical protein
VAGTLSIDDQTKIVRDLGVGAINMIAVLIAVFVGIGLVYNDLDKKTIYTIVSKPIGRWQFLLGKYLGLLLTIAVNVFVMTFIFIAVLHLRDALSEDKVIRAIYAPAEGGGSEYQGAFAHLFYLVKSVFLSVAKALLLGLDGSLYTKGILGTSCLTILEMSVITGFAILFSSFSSPTLSAFLTVTAFIIGRLNEDLYLFAQNMVQKSGGLEALSGGQTIAYYFSTGASYICPNLTLFFDQRKAISQFQDLVFEPVSILYAVVYSTFVLVIAVMVFNRRNFK